MPNTVAEFYILKSTLAGAGQALDLAPPIDSEGTNWGVQFGIVFLFLVLPMFFTLLLRRRVLSQPSAASEEIVARSNRSFQGCSVVFWMSWLAWYYAAAPLAPLEHDWNWLHLMNEWTPALPAILIGTIVTICTRQLIYPAYIRQPDTTYPRKDFLLQGLWISGLLGTILIVGRAFPQSLNNPLHAILWAAVFVICVRFFWRRLLSATGIVARPLSEGAFRERVDQLATVADTPPLRGLYVVHTAYRPVFNAFVSTSRRLYITDTLIRRLTTREVDAVVAHELTHLKHNHPIRFWRLLISLVLLGIVAGLSMYWTWETPHPPDVASLFRGGIEPYAACGLGALLGVFAAMGRSRSFEREADEGAVAITGDPEAMISAIATLSRLSHPPQGKRRRRRGRISTHPTVGKRAEYIAAAGGVAPERVEALLAGEVVGEGHYELP